MILVDANILIYAVNRDAPHHTSARRWLEKALSGSEPVGLSWATVLAFIRTCTRPGILARPLSDEAAMAYIDEWLALPMVDVVNPGERHWPVLRNLLNASGTLGNLSSDAHLAALAIEHGATICSADHDFKRFQGIAHVNPLQDDS